MKIQQKYGMFLGVRYVSAILLGFTVQAYAVESVLWQQFKDAKINGTEPTLPDFSYAGYDYSESPLPDTSGWTVFNVTNYGAIADDAGYDQAAIQATIDAAEAAGGGIVFFPPGQFIVSDNNDITDNIFIRESNILLKGSGSGTNGTEIFMDEMKVDNGRYIFEVKPTSTSESTMTTVASNAPRESYEIEVANAFPLSVNDRIILYCNSTNYAVAYYDPQPIDPAWTRLLDPTRGFQMRELHTVAAIDGNTVTLREPLHLPMITEYNGESIEIRVRSYNVITNVGVEDILFKGNWDSYPETFVHHKDDIHDYAWNALRFDNVANGWLRDCDFKDWNQSVYFDGCAAFTVSNITFTGKRGHASIHTRRCYGMLIQDCVDTADHHHGPGVGYWNAGTVYLRHQMFSNQNIDSHSGSPYATLMDSISGGQLNGNGGPHESYPHHGKYFVFWNFSQVGPPSNYDFWPSSRNGHTFAMPYLIGMHGWSSTFTPGTYAINESQGTPVEPASLFEAQLAFRLSPDKDEDGLEDAWELAHFSDLTTTDGLPAEDYDNDLFIDRSEFYAGTIPTDSNSLLRITSLERSTNTSPITISLTWDAVTGKTYHVMSNTDLGSSWSNLWTTVATNTSSSYEFLTTENPLFLQIEVEY